MKLRFIYTFFGCMFMAFLLMSNTFGRAEGFGWGNTGAPGDETLPNGNPRTCMSCHNTGTAFQVTLDIDILNNDGESVTTYIPDELYTARVTVNHVSGSAPAGYGFQIVNLYDSDDSDVNLFSAPDTNTKVAMASNTGKFYAEHNGVNGQGNNGGDAAACNTLTLTEDGASSTTNINYNNSIAVYPNPANEFLTIENKGIKSGLNQLTVVDQLGQAIFSSAGTLQQDETIQLNISEFQSGVYQIILESADEQMVKRFVKL